MKIGRICIFVLLIALAPAIGSAVKKPLSVSQLKSILAKQGFSGILKGDVHFSKIGTLACGADQYQVFYYEWQESHPPGLAVHAQYRVLFVQNDDNYIGSYAVQDHPLRISGDSLIFGYVENLGNRIQCDAHGLPTKLVLNGELGDLFK